jgi:hypothetical protein
VDGWSSEEPEEIMVGDRRMRVRRRLRRTGRINLIVVLVAIVVVAGAGYGLFMWWGRPTGLAALPNPAVVAPGGFQSQAGADKTITVGLEIRNTSDVDIVVAAARIVPPAGLRLLTLTLAPPGEGNKGFALDDVLRQSSGITLGTDGPARNGVIAARFEVDCAQLPAEGTPTGEQIFVTVQLGAEQRVDELTPPVVNGTPWLTATARRTCVSPVTTASPAPPLPPMPGGTPSA